MIKIINKQESLTLILISNFQAAHKSKANVRTDLNVVDNFYILLM